MGLDLDLLWTFSGGLELQVPTPVLGVIMGTSPLAMQS